MVFSFFKKNPKDPKDAKHRSRKGASGARPATPAAGRVPPMPVGRPLAEPVNRSLNRASLPSQRFATTENAIPDKELARSLAMETAAKIDAIESEMARDFLRPSQQNVGANTGGGAAVATQRLSATLPAPAAIASRDDDAFDGQGDALAGSIDAIEIHTSGAGSVIDETAILFANGQIEEAEANLRAAIAADDLGHARQMAWLMLFELINQRGDRAAFEQLTIDYVRRFESSPPAWIDYAAAQAPRPGVGAAPAAAGVATVRLPTVVDANVVKPLESLKQLAASHPTLTLDASAVRSIDLVGAELLLRVFNAFKRASHELIVQGAEQFINPLRAAIEPGRRDASDAGWMLLLEVFRLLGRQDDFDETGIQYCITFEVSPPSWEPAPPNMKTRAAAPAAAATTAVSSDDPLAWHGVIEAEGEPFFGRLAALARVHKELAVDCGQLRRMAFSAASALLTLVMKLQQGGSTVEFRDVNVMVGALFQLLGITTVAAVQLRRS
ncbi:MAG: STAS domain-containing protein [Pseudomonadota bacterium]